MVQELVTRRMILLGGASMAALACSDSETSEGGTGNTGGANAGGNDNTGGANAGGANAGGASAGGNNNTGGNDAGACGGALLVQGSNYGTDPHDLAIPLADLELGVTKTYTTTGNGHTHDVTLTEADFAALRNGETVKKYVCYTLATSTDHEWVISCADPSIMPTFEGEIGTPNNCPA